MSILFSLLLALALTTVLIPPLAKLASRFRLVDIPGPRRVHTVPTPRIGGIAMLTATVVAVLVWLRPDGFVVGYLGALAVITVVGIWDDRRNIDYRIKFLAQLAAVSVLVVVGGVRIHYFPFAGLEALPPAVSIPLTVFLLMAVTNAVNLSDGLDGLAGGTALLSLGVLGALAFEVVDTTVLILIATVAGATLGFLRYNSFPARVFMGDTGSQFLGLSVGTLTILVTQQANTALSPAIPLLIIGLPIIDTLMVMGLRLREGRSPFSPDKHHIHHKLMALGLAQHESVFVIYVVQSVFVIAAYLMRYDSDLAITATYGALCASALAVYQLFARRAPVFGEGGTRRRLGLNGLLYSRSFRALPGNVIRFTLPVFLCAGALLSTEVPRDFGFAAAALLGLLVTAFAVRHLPAHLFERICLFAVSSFVLYLLHRSSGPSAIPSMWPNVYALTLALMLVPAIRVARSGMFRVSPLDYLIVCAALVADYFRDQGVGGEEIGALALRMIVLFYACEYLALREPRTWDFLRAGLLAALAVLAVRGVLL